MKIAAAAISILRIPFPVEILNSRISSNVTHNERHRPACETNTREDELNTLSKWFFPVHTIFELKWVSVSMATGQKSLSKFRYFILVAIHYLCTIAKNEEINLPIFILHLQDLSFHYVPTFLAVNGTSLLHAFQIKYRLPIIDESNIQRQLHVPASTSYSRDENEDFIPFIIQKIHYAWHTFQSNIFHLNRHITCITRLGSVCSIKDRKQGAKLKDHGKKNISDIRYPQILQELFHNYIPSI